MKCDKRCNSLSPSRGSQFMPMAIAFQRAQGGDVLTHINEWEAAINVLERDYREEISDMSNISLFLGMVPEDLPVAATQTTRWRASSTQERG